MNEIVRAGLVGAGFLFGVALLVGIMSWLSAKSEEKIPNFIGTSFMVILGILLFIMVSVIVGSLLLSEGIK